MSETTEITNTPAEPSQDAAAGPLLHTLIITNDGELLENSIHTSPAARLKACVAALKEANRGEVDEEELDALMAESAGGDPDDVVSELATLHADHGYDIYYEDKPLPEVPDRGVPVALYSVLQSFENSEQNTLVHHRTVADRQAAMRRTLNSIGAAVEPDNEYSDAELAALVEARLNSLLDQKVTVHLATSLVPVWAI